MGLTIHYRGRIRDYSLVEELVTEVKCFAEGLNWDYVLIEPEGNPSVHKADAHAEDDFPEVKGIIASPDDCEPIILTFLEDGRLCSPFFAPMEAEDGLPYLFTKTQSAGPLVHFSFVKLLKRLNEKYFSELKVLDESNYWETEDENILLTRFGYQNVLINKISNAIKEIESTSEGGSGSPDYDIETIYFGDRKDSA